MDKKLIKIDMKLNIIFRGFIYAMVIMILVVSVLGYVFSYNEIKVFTKDQNAIPRLINLFIISNIIFIVFVGLFTFVIGGINFNLKNVIKIILIVPVELLIMVGYVLASEHLTIAYDTSNYTLIILFILTAFCGGMKYILHINRDYNHVKEDTK